MNDSEFFGRVVKMKVDVILDFLRTTDGPVGTWNRKRCEVLDFSLQANKQKMNFGGEKNGNRSKHHD